MTTGAPMLMSSRLSNVRELSGNGTSNGRKAFRRHAKRGKAETAWRCNWHLEL